MSSREKILSSIKNNQPEFSALPVVQNFVQPFIDVVEKYKTVLQSIGGNVYEVNHHNECFSIIKQQFAGVKRIVTVYDAFVSIAELYQSGKDAHFLQDVDVAIIPTHFAVAENGSVWITEDLVKERVLPFICQHLVAIVDKKNIVASMHDAYEIIADRDYAFATFIAGPSKTADIEQSLVLGAHGPKTLTVFIVGE
jgi:L-lactate dehydrogenase complex protein LldG